MKSATINESMGLKFAASQYLYDIDSFIDCHTHILPGIDDGCKNASMSTELINHSKEKNINYLCFTPHFYPDRNKPDAFLEKRKKAYEAIENKENTCLGAEVAYFVGISKYTNIRDFCLGNSKYILIEMPFEKWSYFEVDEIINLVRDGLTPIIAHYERFLKYGNLRYIRFLQANGCLIQSNSEFFINPKTKRKAIRHLNKGFIDILASDCHNLDHRNQTLPEALIIIIQNARENILYSMINKYENMVEKIFKKKK